MSRNKEHRHNGVAAEGGASVFFVSAHLLFLYYEYLWILSRGHHKTKLLTVWRPSFFVFVFVTINFQDGGFVFRFRFSN